MTVEDKSEIKQMLTENNKEIKEIILDVAGLLQKQIQESESGTQLLIQDLEYRVMTCLEVLTTDMQLVKEKLGIHEDQIMTHQSVKLERSDIKAEALVS